jgi:hypothetical protein
MMPLHNKSKKSPLEIQMSKKNIIRIILSLLGLSIGILMVIGSLRREAPNTVLAGSGAALSIFSIGWLFNLGWIKIITGILFIPVGLAGSLWTIWDFFQDILFDKGVIGNFPLLGYGMTIFLLPYLLILGVFCWILVVGFNLVKGK